MNKTTIKPCIPTELSDINLDWSELVEPIAKASDSIGRFDGALEGMVNAHILMAPLTRMEAVLSSKIEGTQASFVEVLEHEAGKLAEEETKRTDIREIQNYRNALHLGEDYLKDRPITLQLIRELHEALMDSVRGQNKNPGKFREDQNWIGPKGCKIEQARFIPPNPAIMRDSLLNLEKFISSDYKSRLVQIGIIHAQFEIIHPFNDGNGRLGRMLIPLFLYYKKVLQSPVLYLSQYIEEHDEEYRNKLLGITKDGNWQAWIEFFLRALNEQAKLNHKKAKKIHTLYEEMKYAFSEVTKSRFASTALDTFFAAPIVSATDFFKISNIHNKKTSYAILKNLEDAQLIVAIKKGVGRTPSIYAIPELINAVEGKEVFEKIKA